MKPSTRGIYGKNWYKYKAICLNDSGETTKTDLELARKRLNKMFPKPCGYEIVIKTNENKEKPKNNVSKEKPIRKKKGTATGRPEGKTWNEFFY